MGRSNIGYYVSPPVSPAAGRDRETYGRDEEPALTRRSREAWGPGAFATVLQIMRGDDKFRLCAAGEVMRDDESNKESHDEERVGAQPRVGRCSCCVTAPVIVWANFSRVREHARLHVQPREGESD